MTRKRDSIPQEPVPPSTDYEAMQSLQFVHEQMVAKGDAAAKLEELAFAMRERLAQSVEERAEKARAAQERLMLELMDGLRRRRQ